jgi:hypothetical protein
MTKEEAEKLVDKLLKAPEAMDYAHARSEIVGRLLRDESWRGVVERTVPGLYTKYPWGPQNDTEYWSVRAALAEANRESTLNTIALLTEQLSQSVDDVAVHKTRADAMREVVLAACRMRPVWDDATNNPLAAAIAGLKMAGWEEPEQPQYTRGPNACGPEGHGEYGKTCFHEAAKPDAPKSIRNLTAFPGESREEIVARLHIPGCAAAEAGIAFGNCCQLNDAVLAVLGGRVEDVVKIMGKPAQPEMPSKVAPPQGSCPRCERPYRFNEEAMFKLCAVCVKEVLDSAETAKEIMGEKSTQENVRIILRYLRKIDGTAVRGLPDDVHEARDRLEETLK